MSRRWSFRHLFLKSLIVTAAGSPFSSLQSAWRSSIFFVCRACDEAPRSGVDKGVVRVELLAALSTIDEHVVASLSEAIRLRSGRFCYLLVVVDHFGSLVAFGRVAFLRKNCVVVHDMEIVIVEALLS